MRDGGQAAGAIGAEPGAILPLTRAGVGALLVLAIANGVFLYLAPSQAEPHYAWPVAPPASAAMMGAGYLAGALATALATFAARRFGSIRALVPGFCALGILLLAATLIHADRFRWDYAPTWLWTAVYALLPPIAVWIWLRQSRLAPERPPAAEPRLAPWRAPSATLGAALAAVAIALFIAPDELLDEWPWPLTPLLARVFAGWYLLAALGLAYCGLAARRPHELPIAYATVAAWSLLILAIPPLHSDTTRTDAALFWPWIALHAILLVYTAAALARSVGLMRATGERL